MRWNLKNQAVELRLFSDSLVSLINWQEGAGVEEGRWQEKSEQLLPQMVAV